MSENHMGRPFSAAMTITGFSPTIDGQADLYDQQTAPMLHKLSRNGSVTSLQNGFTEQRGPPKSDPVMSPGAFVVNPTPTPNQANPPPSRPSLHSRSVTTPVNNIPKVTGLDLTSEDETDDIFSEDERATGHGGSRTPGPGLRAVHNGMRKVQPGVSGKEYRQRDLLRGQSRSRNQTPDSPDVPKVPDAYLRENSKLPTG